MSKFAYLSARVVAAIFVLFLIAALGVYAIISLGYWNGHLQLSLLWGLPLLLALVGMCLWVFLSILKPYREAVRLQRAFLAEQIYNELFQPVVYLTPEIQQVLERFRYMLSKQEIVSLSKKQAEYLALQNQINPHFLYNTLEAIRGDALDAGQEGIAKPAEALATYFRYTITEMGDLVTVEDELNNIDSYFTIQRYRFNDKLKLNVLADEEIVYRCKIPKLTLQPIVENSIFHGLESKSGDGLITIQLEATQSRILISINGDLSLTIGGQYVDVAYSFILLYNALRGTPLASEPVEVPVNFISAYNAQEFDDYMKYVHNDIFAYTADEIKSMIKVFTPDANADQLLKMGAAFSIEDCKTRHADLLK